MLLIQGEFLKRAQERGISEGFVVGIGGDRLELKMRLPKIWTGDGFSADQALRSYFEAPRRFDVNQVLRISDVGVDEALDGLMEDCQPCTGAINDWNRKHRAQISLWQKSHSTGPLDDYMHECQLSITDPSQTVTYHMDLVPEGVKRKMALEEEEEHSKENPQKKPCCRVSGSRVYRYFSMLDERPLVSVEEGDSCKFPWEPEDAMWVSEEEDRLMGMS